MSESVTTISIAAIIDRTLRSDDVLRDLEHFMSVQTGGYTRDERNEADETYNDIVEVIAKEIMDDVRRDRENLVSQIAELKERYSKAEAVLNENQQLELDGLEDDRDISEMEFDPASGSYH